MLKGGSSELKVHGHLIVSSYSSGSEQGSSMCLQLRQLVPLALSFICLLWSLAVPCNSRLLSSLAKTIGGCSKSLEQSRRCSQFCGWMWREYSEESWSGSQRCGHQSSESQPTHCYQKSFKHLGCLYLMETLMFLPESKVSLPSSIAPKVP